jgi:carboxylesterase
VHDPFERRHVDTDTIVIFSHGFIGSPSQFEDLADLAYQNKCSVLSLLLPGHGGTAKEFSKFGLRDWENHLESEIQRISSTYKNIILVGHSMGGLLSLNTSLNKKCKVKSVLLISSPLKLKYSLHTLLLGIKLTIFPKSTDEMLVAYRRSNSVLQAPIFTYALWRKQLSDVYRLMAKTKSNLPDVTVPTTIILSKKDETVSLKSAELFRNGLKNTNKKLLILDESRHAFYVPKERERICQELLHLITERGVS